MSEKGTLQYIFTENSAQMGDSQGSCQGERLMLEGVTGVPF